MPASTRARRWPPELLVLTALAALTRFWDLFYPHAVVFDEVHYEKFVADYLARVFYLDVHPPLANQIFAVAAKLLHLPILTLGHPYPAPTLRIVPALAGTLIIPVFYVLLRRLGASRRLATLGGALLLLDNALLVESRVVVPDSMLVLFDVGAVTVFLAARRSAGRARWSRLAGAALLAGLAVSLKWTGLSALGIIGTVWLVDVVRARPGWRRPVGEGALLLGLPVALYLTVFAVHFAWMTHNGPGVIDVPPSYRATLIGSDTYDPHAHLSYFRKLIILNRAMRRMDAGFVNHGNGAASPWYAWPTIQHPITFWSDTTSTPGRVASIYLEGNPVVWYGIFVAAAVGALGFLRRRERWTVWREPVLVLALAYAATFLPFAAIQRAMYQYSYFMAFVYSLGLAVLGLGVVAGWAGPAPGASPDDEPLWRFPSRRSAALYWGVLALAVLGFLYYAPVSYGWPISHRAFAARFWIVERHF